MMDATNSRPTVLFVGSSGRSGSTLFDVMLGQVPGFVAVGELRHIWTRSLLRNQMCGCGKKFWDCPFWNEVTLRAFGPRSSFDPEQIWEEARPRMARKGIRFAPAAHWFSKYAKGLGRERWVLRQAEVRGRLYRAIADVSGAKVIVDTSKMPEDGVVAMRVHEVDVKMLHLVRDSRGVAYSWSKPRSDPSEESRKMRRRTLYSSIEDWATVNLILEILCNSRSSVRIRYEDLIATPEPTLRKIIEFATDAAAPPLTFLSGNTAQIGPTHTVSGNPLRFHQGPLTLRVDDEWRRAMGAPSRAAVTLATAPLLARYGYDLSFN
ncbi:MAG: sulfotransferase [Deltaproteobacteria bacterium]|nr:sulfotransferase [Deltaproteobacteria bacterium]